MNIYRRGRKGFVWEKTDSKESDGFSELWASNDVVTLDGTIDKEGERHTEIGLELEDDDVVSLFNALIDKYRNKIEELNSELNGARNITNEKTEALATIDNLICYHSEDAPTLDSLIGAVQTIASHFTERKVVGTQPNLKWIKYENIHGHYKDGRFYEGKVFQ